MALAYLFCALAPSLSFAFADGSRSAPCIIEDHDPGMLVHMHMHESATGPHVHDAATMHHDHAHGAAMAHDGLAGHEGGLPVKAPQKTPDSRCCGLVSVSAMPAGETALVQPAALVSLCEAEPTRGLTDNAPPRHYRPPIS